MIYPTLKVLGTSRQMIDVFGGYNHNLRIGEGEFYDMTNLTSADYPVLSPRPKRGIYDDPYLVNPTAMLSKDALCYVDGKDFVINNYRVDMGLSNEPKTLVSMGAYVIIMPDKKYINTASPGADEGVFDHGDIEATVSANFFDIYPCLLDGKLLVDMMLPAPPAEPKNLDYWLDTSSDPFVLKQYSSDKDEWLSVPTTYLKISSQVLNDIFSEGDGITISVQEGLSGLEGIVGTHVVQAVGENYIIIKGMLRGGSYGEATAYGITFKRLMPKMDFIIESGNRLWGCRYGTDNNGDVVNEIYASKLGDFKNWSCFSGISTDSYAASVGTDGQFTGAVTYLGYPIFFKENCIHKVYGNFPSNYQIQTTSCRGVQQGCSKSIAIVNETLFYKSRSAICAYDGSLPSEVSSALGDVAYSDAVAGVLGNKYYISMKNDKNEYSLFVFDTKKGMWHREDDTQVMEFCSNKGNLYYIDYGELSSVKKIKSVVATDDDPYDVKWSAITGYIGTDSPDKKYISGLVVRLSLEVGASVVFYAEYDSSGEWEHLFTKDGTKLGSVSIPVRPKRCDHMRLRIEGKGMAKIYSICKTIEQGSDV